MEKFIIFPFVVLAFALLWNFDLLITSEDLWKRFLQITFCVVLVVFSLDYLLQLVKKALRFVNRPVYNEFIPEESVQSTIPARNPDSNKIRVKEVSTNETTVDERQATSRTGENIVSRIKSEDENKENQVRGEDIPGIRSNPTESKTEPNRTESSPKKQAPNIAGEELIGRIQRARDSQQQKLELESLEEAKKEAERGREKEKAVAERKKKLEAESSMLRLGSDSSAMNLQRARAEQQIKLAAEATARAEKKKQKQLEVIKANYEKIQQSRAEGGGRFLRPGEELKEWVSLESEERQNIRSQQDLELADSLRRDEERERETRTAEERKLEEQARRREALVTAKMRRQELREALPDEPPLGDKSRTLIGLRLPDSQTLRRAWRQENTIEQLYQWVESLEDMGNFPNNFVLSTTYPRTRLNRSDFKEQTFLEMGLVPHCVLMIEEL